MSLLDAAPASAYASALTFTQPSAEASHFLFKKKVTAILLCSVAVIPSHQRCGHIIMDGSKMSVSLVPGVIGVSQTRKDFCMPQTEIIA
jgi:hypothetical protein